MEYVRESDFDRWLKQLDDVARKAGYDTDLHQGSFSALDPLHWLSVFDDGLTPEQAWESWYESQRLYMDATP